MELVVRHSVVDTTWEEIALLSGNGIPQLSSKIILLRLLPIYGYMYNVPILYDVVVYPSLRLDDRFLRYHL